MPRASQQRPRTAEDVISNSLRHSNRIPMRSNPSVVERQVCAKKFVSPHIPRLLPLKQSNSLRRQVSQPHLLQQNSHCRELASVRRPNTPATKRLEDVRVPRRRQHERSDLADDKSFGTLYRQLSWRQLPREKLGRPASSTPKPAESRKVSEDKPIPSVDGTKDMHASSSVNKREEAMFSRDCKHSCYGRYSESVRDVVSDVAGAVNIESTCAPQDLDAKRDTVTEATPFLELLRSPRKKLPSRSSSPPKRIVQKGTDKVVLLSEKSDVSHAEDIRKNPTGINEQVKETQNDLREVSADQARNEEISTGNHDKGDQQLLEKRSTESCTARMPTSVSIQQRVSERTVKVGNNVTGPMEALRSGYQTAKGSDKKQPDHRDANSLRKIANKGHVTSMLKQSNHGPVQALQLGLLKREKMVPVESEKLSSSAKNTASDVGDSAQHSPPSNVSLRSTGVVDESYPTGVTNMHRSEVLRQVRQKDYSFSNLLPLPFQSWRRLRKSELVFRVLMIVWWCIILE